jgi:hypothetical protein
MLITAGCSGALASYQYFNKTFSQFSVYFYQQSSLISESCKITFNKKKENVAIFCMKQSSNKGTAETTSDHSQYQKHVKSGFYLINYDIFFRQK